MTVITMGVWSDCLFLTLAVFVMPAWAIYRRRLNLAPIAGVKKYFRSSVYALILLMSLALAWYINHRSFRDLGLNVPVDKRGLIGVFVSIMLLLIFYIISHLPVRSKMGAAKIDPDQLSNFRLNSQVEWLAFIIFTALTCMTWEVIYRASLMYLFKPYLGVPWSIVLSAVIYTVAHGAKTLLQFFGTFVAAVLFLLYFILSGNLWGAIIVHIGIPLIVAVVVNGKRFEGLLNP